MTTTRTQVPSFGATALAGTAPAGGWTVQVSEDSGGMVLSALQVFESEFTRHTQQLGCAMPPPLPGAARWTW